ncbi:MAG: hypothetical protein QNI95_05685 [Desulfobacterales bacterium]|nr:hypothetical protein [Desulfobacterales bacterium]
MYYPYFIAYMASGFVISLVIFFWALNKGQFNNQQRARFLALESHAAAGPIKLSRKGRLHAVILLIMASAGLVTSMIAVTLIVLNLVG